MVEETKTKSKADMQPPKLPPDFKIKKETLSARGTPCSIGYSVSEDAYYWLAPSGFEQKMYVTRFKREFLEKLKNLLENEGYIIPRDQMDTLLVELGLPPGYQSYFYILTGFYILCEEYKNICFTTLPPTGKRKRLLMFYRKISDSELVNALEELGAEKEDIKNYMKSLNTLNEQEAIKEKTTILNLARNKIEEERLEERSPKPPSIEDISSGDKLMILFIGKSFIVNRLPNPINYRELEKVGALSFPELILECDHYDELTFGLKDYRVRWLVAKGEGEYNVILDKSHKSRPLITLTELKELGISFMYTETPGVVALLLPKYINDMVENNIKEPRKRLK
ncbi:MAG: hypothetical protein QXX38_00620 [Candidatus Aenigmatarchaeota archaeon]